MSEKVRDMQDRVKRDELVDKIKKELPNIVLPSMGMGNDIPSVDVNGEEFVISNKEE